MAVLILDEDYRITSDVYNWTLQKKHTAEKGYNKGEVVWSNISYHASIKQAVESYLERSLRLSDANSLQELQDISKYCLERIEELFNKVNI